MARVITVPTTRPTSRPAQVQVEGIEAGVYTMNTSVRLPLGRTFLIGGMTLDATTATSPPPTAASPAPCPGRLWRKLWNCGELFIARVPRIILHFFELDIWSRLQQGGVSCAELQGGGCLLRSSCAA